MKKIDSCLTYIERESDRPYLTTKLLDVNMHLFKCSKTYKRLILQSVELIVSRLTTIYEDYTKPFGMSGANCAVPFNIIAYFENRNRNNERVVTMLNPKIVEYIGNPIEVRSNCGSIRLDKPIHVKRWLKIKVAWYDILGNEYEETIDRNSGSLTIQHEVDHNNGILIIDKAV